MMREQTAVKIDQFIKHKRIWLSLLLAYAAAFAANVGTFAWSFDIGWMEIVTSAVYALAWLFFVGTGFRDRKKMRFFAGVGVVMTVGGVLGVLIRTFPGAGLTIFGLLTAGVTVTPLYGLLGLIEDYDVFYLIVAILGAIWFAVGSALCYSRSRKRDKTN